MKTTEQRQDAVDAMEAICGLRGTADFAGDASRKLVRAWLMSEGWEHARANSVLMPALHEIVNDLSNTLLDAGRAEISTAPVAPAPVAPVTSTGMGVMDDAINGMIDAKLGAFSGGIDVDAVVDITNDILRDHKAPVDLTPVGALIDAKLAEVKPLLDAVANDAKLNGGRRAPIIRTVAGGDETMEELAPYYRPGIDCGVNVLLTSPPSFGKSHTARKLGGSYDLYLEHGCSGDMDEIATMLGGPVPDGAGGFVIIDGVLSQAVRAASTGQTVMLMLDEVLRLPEIVQEWLLTFLTAVETPDGRVYRLRTRKAVNGVLEVIECKAENLHILAATNLGMALPPEAFWSRFETIRIEWTEKLARAVGQSILNDAGIVPTSGDPVLAKEFAKIMGESRVAMKSGRIKMPVDFRMLKRQAMVASTPDESAVAAMLAKRLPGNVVSWDGDSGDMIEESKTLADSWTARFAKL